MANYGGGLGPGLGRSVRRAPVLGGPAQNPNMLSALQQLFRQSVDGGGGPQMGIEPPGLGGQPGAPGLMPGGGFLPGGGPVGSPPGDIHLDPREMPGVGFGPGAPGVMPGMGSGHLIPLPNPQLPPRQSAGDLRRGLLELLHPNIRGIIGRKIQPGRPIGGSIPQNNRRIVIPAGGPFHHNASVANGPTKGQMLTEVRHQHVEDAQARAGQMANLMRKSRGMGPVSRRAIPAGY